MKFEEKYVRIFWSDEMDGKLGFTADSIPQLSEKVAEDYPSIIFKGDYPEHPFSNHLFCYYDPCLSLKLAYNQGKIIQTFNCNLGRWEDCTVEPNWDLINDETMYRVKGEVLGFKEIMRLLIDSKMVVRMNESDMVYTVTAVDTANEVFTVDGKCYDARSFAVTFRTWYEDDFFESEESEQ